MPVDVRLVRKTLEQLGTFFWEGKEVNLYAGYEDEVAKFIDEYLTENPEYTFVGPPQLAEATSHITLDNAHPGIWKDSDTTDWKLTPTGLGTFNNVFPEESSKAIRLDTPPPHWAYLLGLVEIGSANNIVRIDFKSVNGKRRGRVTNILQSRIGELKVIRFNPGVKMKTRGYLDMDIEFETNVATEVMPLAVHILPFEIATGLFAGYVTAVSI